jgi:hypothetical protein
MEQIKKKAGEEMERKQQATILNVLFRIDIHVNKIGYVYIFGCS